MSYFSTLLCLYNYLKRGHTDLEAQLLLVSKIYLYRLSKIDKIKQLFIYQRKKITWFWYR